MKMGSTERVGRLKNTFASWCAIHFLQKHIPDNKRFCGVENLGSPNVGMLAVRNLC